MIYSLIISLLFLISGSSDYKSYLTEGDNLYRNWDNFSAIKEYEKAYKLAPNDYQVLVRLARTYNDAGEELKELRRRDEAEPFIIKALDYSEKLQKKYPDSAASYTYLAFSYGNLAMYKGGKEKVSYAKKIEENCKKAIAKSQSDYLPYIILGIYYREIASLGWIERAFANAFFGGVPDGSYEDSEKMFRKVLSMHPDMMIAMYQLSKTYRAMEREKDEVALLNKILTLKNSDFRDKFTKEKVKRRLAELKS